VTVAEPIVPPAPPSGALWGYGRFGEDQLFPLSHDDIRRDTAIAARALCSLALPDRSIIVLASKVADVGHLHPLLEAARELGHVVANADASAMDVERVAMFARLLPVAAVIGVNEEMLVGMREGGIDLQLFFSDIPVVLALGSAYDRLVESGVDARRMEILGPALAMECRYRRLHVDGVEWAVEERGGNLLISSRRPRALTIEAFDTGRSGGVADVVCACGRSGPVIEWLAAGRVGERG
jgi:hypothetical protein